MFWKRSGDSFPVFPLHSPASSIPKQPLMEAKRLASPGSSGACKGGGRLTSGAPVGGVRW